MRTLQLALGTSAALLFLVSGLLRTSLFLLLKRNFRQTWETLGCPSLLWNNSVSIEGRVQRFLWRTPVESMRTQRLRCLVLLERTCEFLSLLLLIGLLVLGLVG
jgi:hypothetical protein